MNNYNFLINLNNRLRISNYENNLGYDNSYMSYFKNSNIEESIFIVKNTLIKKILEKQIIYKNKEELDEINNCLDYIIKNLNSINNNKIYNDVEMELFKKLENDIIKYNNNANENIIKNENKDVIIFIEEDSQSFDNNSIFSNTCLIQDENEDEYENKNKNKCSKKSIKNKIYSISIKIKNYIKTGFKKIVNFIYSKYKKF